MSCLKCADVKPKFTLVFFCEKKSPFISSLEIQYLHLFAGIHPKFQSSEHLNFPKIQLVQKFAKSPQKFTGLPYQVHN